MDNFFNFNFNFPFGMNNWFMPNWSFQNMFSTFQMPNFNIFNNWFNSFNSNFSFQQTSPSLFYDVTTPVDYSNNTDTFTKSKINYAKDNLKLGNYNAQKGERLANIALNCSVGWTGYCARYVKNSIQAANLGNYQYGHAYQMTDILKNNSNFKEISTDGVDVAKLPAGCVLVYDKGTQGYSKKYGHTEITTGDGRAVSDGVTRHLYKKPSAIFIPV